MIRTGMIVRIKEFKGDNHYEGVWCPTDMAAMGGEIHVVTRQTRTYSFKLDDRGFRWPSCLLEPVEGLELPIVAETNNGRFNTFVPVVYRDNDPQMGWYDEEGLQYYPSSVGILNKTRKPLPFDLYGVGKEGDTIDVVVFHSVVFLDEKYLPMHGVLERGMEF